MLWNRRFFLVNKQQINVLARFLSASKTDEIHVVEHPITPGYLSRVLGSTSKYWSEALTKHKELQTVKREHLVSSAETLKSLNYTIREILDKPMLLYQNTLTIQNRHNVLKECGCETISLNLLFKFVTVMNRDISTLKSQRFLPFDIDIQERLRTRFTDIDVYVPSKYGEEIKLKKLRENILNFYLKQRLDMSEKDLEKLWRVYSRVRHRSFNSIQQMVKILLDDLNFPKERIAKNAFLLYGDPENVYKMLEQIPSIDGQDFRTILFKTPKILMSSAEGLVKSLNHIKSFGIKENAVVKCLEILTLSPDTVLDRLNDLQDIEEFQVLKTNPRILRLVHYQNKARLRLDYLNQLKVRCASLHVLSCSSDAFVKFAREGSDRTKGRDVVVFLSNKLKESESSIRTILTRHPNWCHIPVVQVNQCYDYLLTKEFTNEDIFSNLYLLLYPIKRIEEKLTLLYTTEILQDLKIEDKITDIDKSKILALVLYLIESEFHFTGDGIWTEQHSLQVENFHNLLPDFPESNKVHRYGVKEKGTNKTTTASAFV
ncbi:transcription termination factor 5, mitochondrial [Episyrphus balteatus]|uniref:transcription termination factor 5, mitochondrial n=1 Tax=Episyrphus balteatus TaxID=286459 RepID=UPI0024855913|nr:transcription termination factor 5, mitochondrial [Episyrphus balteatus]